MKKLLLVLIVGMMLVFCGCPDKKDTNSDKNKVEVMKIDLKASKVLMNNYMRFFLKDNNGAMRSFYGGKVKVKLKNTPRAKEPHPLGYLMDEGEIMEEKAVFKVHIFNGTTNLPYFSDDEFTYTVALEKEKMVIYDIVKGKSVELYSKNDNLYKREGDKLEGEKLISLKDLPNYVVPKESSSIEQKFAVPKKAFGPSALSPDGKTTILTSYDKNSFIGMIEEESSEAMAQTASKAPGGEQGGSGGSGGQGGSNGGTQGSSGQSGGAKPNLKLKMADFYFDSMVNNINFSPDGKMFLIEFTPKNGHSQLLVYMTNTGEVVKFKTNKQFGKDRFSITNAYFPSPEELIFTAIPNKDATPEEKKFKGDWQLEMKKGKIKKIE